MIDEICENIDKYRYFQALRLLRVRTGDVTSRWLRLYPAANISFPSSEIRYGSMDQDGRLCLHMNFMGLYGVDAPVPLYISDYIAGNRPGSECLVSFLAFLSIRFYELLFDAWVKYHPYQLYQETGVRRQYETILEAVGGIHGLGMPSRLLEYVSLLGSSDNGVAGLESMISGLLDGIPCEIDEYVGKWCEIDIPSKLGEPESRLGDNILLGERVQDACASIRIRVGPVDIDDAVTIRNDSFLLHALILMIESMTAGEVDFTVEISSIAEHHVTSLGDKTACLGLNAILGLADDIVKIDIPVQRARTEPVMEQ